MCCGAASCTCAGRGDCARGVACVAACCGAETVVPRERQGCAAHARGRHARAACVGARCGGAATRRRAPARAGAAVCRACAGARVHARCRGAALCTARADCRGGPRASRAAGRPCGTCCCVRRGAAAAVKAPAHAAHCGRAGRGRCSGGAARPCRAVPRDAAARHRARVLCAPVPPGLGRAGCLGAA